MPVPPECQPIADEIAKLKEEIEPVEGLAGAEKWAALQKNANIRRVIIQKQSMLEQCILLHSPGYETEVVILDLTGSTVSPGEGRLWQLMPPTVQSVVETQTVQNGRIKFLHGGSNPGHSTGISIQDSPNPTFTGPMFRSGPFASLPPGSPANPGGLIEIGVPAPAPVSSAMLSAGLPAPTALPVPAGVTVTALTLTLGAGTATLIAGATVTVSLGIFGTLNLPLAYTLTFGIAPSFNMNDVTEVCLVAPTVPAVITTSLGGLFSFILSLISPSIEPGLTSTVVSAVQGALNSTLLSTAASALGLAALPAGVVVSVRRVVITPSGITFFPALGAYGGLLNKIPFP